VTILKLFSGTIYRKISEELIKDINQQHTIGKLVYLVSRGAVGKTTNLEFLEE
jgi:(2Fe-2S) ferredoxin